MIRLEFQYTPDDLAEEAKVRTAVFAGQAYSPRSAAARLQKTIRTWLVYSLLVVWIGLLVTFLVLNSKRGPSSTAGLPSRVEPPRTHNFLSIVIPPIVAPMLFGALMFAALAKAVVPQRVPFYRPEQPSQRFNRNVYRLAAVGSLITAVALVIVWWRAPLEPDWRPERTMLLFVQFGPWVAWVVLITSVITFVHRRSQKPTLGPEGSWARQPHAVEIDEQAIEVRRGHASNRFAWPYFVSYMETENLLVLYTADLSMLILPKRAFASIEQSDIFRGMVVNHIPHGQFLPPATGFPVAEVRGFPVVPAAGGR